MLEKIKASAGSGKTFTLTQRFLQLLAEMKAHGEQLECGDACRRIESKNGTGVFSEILAMTFTNKAAAEMKSRVIEALKKRVLDQGTAATSGEPGLSGTVASDAAAWLETILRRYDSLNIRTIDSLLALLVRISSGGLQIPPDFEISFDDAAYLEPLYDELLDKAASGDPEIPSLLEDCAAYLVYHTSFQGLTPRDRIRSLILEALAKIQGAPALPCTDASLLHRRLAEAGQKITASANRLSNTLEERGLYPVVNFRKFLDKCLNPPSVHEYPINSAYSRKASLTECVPKKSSTQVDDVLESLYAELCLHLSEQGQKIHIYSSALGLLPFARAAVLLWPGLTELRQNSGAITGSMLPGLARKILDFESGVSEACCRMGSRLTHLLIDEFQDTSLAQWQAIEPLAVECLSRGGSFRYVGDVKQAIYSWRGGDSTLFDQVVRLPQLTDIEPTPVLTHLEFNWRSLPQIIRHNNEFFSQLEDAQTTKETARLLLPASFPEEEVLHAAKLMRRAFEGSGQKVPPQRQNSLTGDGFVSIQKVDSADAGEFLLETKEHFIRLFTEELLPRRRPGDLAVLVRSGDEAALAAAWLMEIGVGIVTEHSFKLSDNPLVRRLLSFLRFIDYPADDLSFWDFVSGPECLGNGLINRAENDSSPSGLLTAENATGLEDWLLSVRASQEADSRVAGKPLFEFFRRDYAESWRMFLEPFHNQAGLMSAYDLISELYRRYGLLHRLPEQAAYLRRFLEVLHLAEKQGYSSPAAFLDFWADKGVEEKLSTPDTPDAVRIMTLHKSKGLEFPVVVMPFHRFTDSASAEMCLTEFEGKTWLVKESPALGAGFFRKKQAAALEKLHLLYVGWTRAEEELHLLIGGTGHDRSVPGMPRVLHYLLSGCPFDENGFYSAGVRPSACDAERIAENNPAVADKDEGCPPEFQAAPLQLDFSELADEDWRPMQWLPRLKIFRNPMPEVAYNERIRGLLFHACLENFHPGRTLFEDSKALLQAIGNTVEYALGQLTLPVENLASARREAAKALSWVCSLPEAREWLLHGRREQSIMDAEGKIHRVDMLLEHENALTVVEYKSGRPRDEYRLQLERYLRLLGGRPQASRKSVSGLLVYLDEQRLESVSAPDAHSHGSLPDLAGG